MIADLLISDDHQPVRAPLAFYCAGRYKLPAQYLENPMSLKSRNAVVTGSTSGIGLAIARALAADGAGVMINALRSLHPQSLRVIALALVLALVVIFFSTQIDNYLTPRMLNRIATSAAVVQRTRVPRSVIAGLLRVILAVAAAGRPAGTGGGVRGGRRRVGGARCGVLRRDDHLVGDRAMRGGGLVATQGGECRHGQRHREGKHREPRGH